jgi:predicted transposase YbfD/YdcC
LAGHPAGLPSHAHPHAQQKTSKETVLAITSLTRVRASVERLLNLSRQHWSIENRLHFVRDVSFGEDACRVRTGHAPQIFSALRILALGLLRRTRHRYVPAAFRHFMAHPLAALALICPDAVSSGEDF